MGWMIDAAVGVDVVAQPMVAWHRPYETAGPPPGSVRIGAVLQGERRAGLEVALQNDVERGVFVLRGEAEDAWTAVRTSPQIGVRWLLTDPQGLGSDEGPLVVPLLGLGVGPTFLWPEPTWSSVLLPSMHAHVGALIGRGEVRTWVDVQARLGTSMSMMPLCAAGDSCHGTSYNVGGTGVIMRGGVAF